MRLSVSCVMATNLLMRLLPPGSRLPTHIPARMWWRLAVMAPYTFSNGFSNCSLVLGCHHNSKSLLATMPVLQSLASSLRGLSSMDVSTSLRPRPSPTLSTPVLNPLTVSPSARCVAAMPMSSSIFANSLSTQRLFSNSNSISATKTSNSYRATGCSVWSSTSGPGSSVS